MLRSVHKKNLIILNFGFVVTISFKCALLELEASFLPQTKVNDCFQKVVVCIGINS